MQSPKPALPGHRLTTIWETVTMSEGLSDYGVTGVRARVATNSTTTPKEMQ